MSDGQRNAGTRKGGWRPVVVRLVVVRACGLIGVIVDAADSLVVGEEFGTLIGANQH
jgi:hypothetical protein